MAAVAPSADVESDLSARLAIQQRIDEWVFCRDNGEWGGLREKFTSDGRMTTNGASFDADGFIAYAQSIRENGIFSHHMTGPSRISVAGERAFSETQATLNVRTKVHDLEVDISAFVRYLDRWAREDGGWKISDRCPVYLLDRMTPVRADTQIVLRDDLLEQCPKGARFLVYLRLAGGGSLPDPMPITFASEEHEALFAQGQRWLKSESVLG